MKRSFALQFGVCLPTFPFGVTPSAERIAEIAHTAETLGYDSIWASDHVLPPADKPRYGLLYEALTTLSYLAGVTRRVRLGTSVLVLPQRNAILVAKQIATLDVLSSGRVILGVGAGWIEGEFAALGADFRRRGRHLDESIRVLRTLWREPQPRFAGEFYRFSDVLFDPRPLQPAGPPVWIGGYTDAALRRAAALGDAWHADDVSGEQLRTMVDRLRALADAVSRSVEVTLRRTVDLRPVVAAAGRLRGSATASGVRAGRFPAGSAGALGGTVEEIAQAVDQVATLGVTHFICQFEHTTQEEHLASLQLFATEIMARFRAAHRT